MIGFKPWRGGYMGGADENERRLLAGVARDVAQLLGYHIDEEADPIGPPDPERDPLEDYEAEFADVEAALEEDDAVAAHHALAPMDNALLRLLPDMAEDPQLAGELRDMTEESISQQKVENLRFFVNSLRQESVWVGNEDVGKWAAAANDIRIVLASRLEIHDEDSARAVDDDAWAILQGEGGGVQNSQDLMKVLYIMLAWWQDSLVQAVRNKQLRG